MTRLIGEGKTVCLYHASETDLAWITDTEQAPENAPFIIGWSIEKHCEAFNNPDLVYLMIREKLTMKLVGFCILAGLTLPHQSLELRRMVISEKGKGFGREALQVIKKWCFRDHGAHRLWLDVKEQNIRALTLYQSEGFIREGILREAVKNENQYESLIVMSILESEYIE
ncbi:GNAT family N-acetyltransferase [Thermoflavimicrobium daqui]|uniref:GNAT family N-acetyltransferase n=1 Tax=Thermoflavimicrobium daqui TaxID=2137476 RepID=A0A364K831_9BACL|nr:GNAT family protein [Thermoflavimicrobium daqui]RAL26438.1 GNAT family N-acetyltransferase [Thermoflavimicrobium daqui]